MELKVDSSFSSEADFSSYNPRFYWFARKLEKLDGCCSMTVGWKLPEKTELFRFKLLKLVIKFSMWFFGLSIKSELKGEEIFFSSFESFPYSDDESSSQDSRSGGKNFDSITRSLLRSLASSKGLVPLPDSVGYSDVTVSWLLWCRQFFWESSIFLACISSSNSYWSIMTIFFPESADTKLCLVIGGVVQDVREAGLVESNSSPLVLRLSDFLANAPLDGLIRSS